MTYFNLDTAKWVNVTTYSTSGNSGSQNFTKDISPPEARAAATLTYVPNLGTSNKGVLVLIGVRSNIP